MNKKLFKLLILSFSILMLVGFSTSLFSLSLRERRTLVYYTGNYEYVNISINGENKGKMYKSRKEKKCIGQYGPCRMVWKASRSFDLEWGHDYTIIASIAGKSLTKVLVIPQYDSNRPPKNKQPRITFNRPTRKVVENRNVDGSKRRAYYRKRKKSSSKSYKDRRKKVNIYKD